MKAELIGKKGQSILEIVIALGLVAVTLSVVVLVSLSNQALFQDSRQNEEALQLARESLELTRASAQADFNSIASSSSVSGIYSKDVVVTTIDANTKKILSRVTWNTDPARTQKVELVAIVTNPAVVPSGTGGDTGGGGLTGDWHSPYTLGSLSLSEDGASATDLDVINKIVYMTTEHNSASKPDFFIIDATVGANPVEISSLNTGPSLNALDATTTHAYVANDSTTSQLQIIDIQNRLSPALISSFTLPGAVGAEGQSIFYYEPKVYIGTENNIGPEFFIIDVSNSSTPVFLGSFEVGGDVNSIHVVGDTAYISTSVNNSEIKVLNIANPLAISELGLFDALNSQDGQSVYLVDTKIYLGRVNGSDKDLEVLNASNPASIQSLGSKEIDTDINGIVVRDCLAFLGTSASNDEFQVWNIADPANISLWKTFNFPQRATGIDYEDNLAYFAARSNNALRIITSTPGGSSC